MIIESIKKTIIDRNMFHGDVSSIHPPPSSVRDSIDDLGIFLPKNRLGNSFMTTKTMGQVTGKNVFMLF